MVDLSGFYYIDGIDLWQAYGLIIQLGSADFLRFPAAKAAISHDWPDQNGIDVDLSKVYLQARTGTLQCVMVADSEAQFFQKHQALLARLVQPGLRRLSITAHGGRSYYVYYKECTTYQQLPGGKLNGLGASGVLHSFGLTFTETNPTIDGKDTHIIADDGAFIIT